MVKRAVKVLDRPFIAALFMIMIFGLVVLASAGGTGAGHQFFYLKKQLFWILIGLGLMAVMLNLDISQGTRWEKYIYGASIVLLLLVLVFGKEVRGAQGWIFIGGNQFQPAELVKILVILSFGSFLYKRQGNLNTLSEMIPCFIYVGIPWLLVMAQPDLGTGLAFLAIMFGMMFVAGANHRILLLLVSAVVVMVMLGLYLHSHFGMWLPLEDYQIKRLTVFTNPYNDGMGGRGAGWNTIQSLVAVGSGGMTGKGLFQGTQSQLNFLPEKHTDFIFAVIGEEMGFIGAAILLILYAVILIRTVHIALNARDFYSTLVAIGLVSMWLFHIFENIGMSIGLMPITGIPLPFISYGGSFMIANFIAIGILLDINIKGKKIVF